MYADKIALYISLVAQQALWWYFFTSMSLRGKSNSRTLCQHISQFISAHTVTFSLYSFTSITFYPHVPHITLYYKYSTILNKKKKEKKASAIWTKKRTSVAYVRMDDNVYRMGSKSVVFERGKKKYECLCAMFFSLHSTTSIVSAIRWYRPLPRCQIRICYARRQQRSERETEKYALVYASIWLLIYSIVGYPAGSQPIFVFPFLW